LASSLVDNPLYSCERAAARAEAEWHLPAGLLSAIGLVESGRGDLDAGRPIAWPWSVNAGGHGFQLPSKATAIRLVRELQATGWQAIDVGCFQISLLHHPTAFTDLEQAFDPAANADYAARFLTELHGRYGNWPDAVAAYHSATASLGQPYRQAVYAKWGGAPDSAMASAAPRNVEPVTIYQIGGATIRVWTPGRAGSQPAMMAVNGGAALPRIITPGG